MRALNQAYAVLGNPVKRAEYDRLRLSQAPTRGRATAVRSSPYPTRRTAPFLIVQPTSLTFGSVVKGASKTIELQVGMSDGRPLIGDVYASQPWITVTPQRLFTESAVVRVQVDTSTLSEGAYYTGSVIIESIAYGTRSIPVSLRVAPQPKPVLLVTPSQIDFGILYHGRAPKVVSIRISNGGPGLLRGTIRTRPSWLSVSQSTFEGNAISLQAIADAGSLRPGQRYLGEIDITSNGGRFIMTAAMTVGGWEDAHPPTDRAEEPQDLRFLQERLRILEQVADPTVTQRGEATIIRYLLRTCVGNDVAVTLQRGIEGAQGYQDPGWLTSGEADGLRPEAMLPILTDLFQRLRKYEMHGD
jgi:hypothetical protein